jgi:hypothetical protein
MTRFFTDEIPEPDKDPINWKSVVLWVLGVLTTVSLTVGSVASGTLWGHDSRLTTIETKMPSLDKRIDDHEVRDARSWDKLDATLKRFEDKLDRVAEKIK